MEIHYSINHLPVFKNAVITIGTFDGVHLGHQQIIKQLKKEAALINGETVLITFHPHPRTIIAGGKTVYLLNTLDEKIILLKALDVDHLVVVGFDEAFSNLTPDEYVQKFLFEKFRPHTLIIGYDHRFGKNRAGDYHLLENYGRKLGFAVKEISEKIINEVIVSSTRIRKALLHGDIKTANNYLGYLYFFEGMVVDGNKLGRTLGYPTANIVVNDAYKLIPADGIYVVEVEIVNRESSIVNNELQSKRNESVQLLKGMMSIGVRPTIDGKNRVIEVNIFDFAKDIYGSLLHVIVHDFLRPELKFNSLDELKINMDNDKHNSLKYFESLK